MDVTCYTAINTVILWFCMVILQFYLKVIIFHWFHCKITWLVDTIFFGNFSHVFFIIHIISINAMMCLLLDYPIVGLASSFQQLLISAIVYLWQWFFLICFALLIWLWTLMHNKLAGIKLIASTCASIHLCECNYDIVT